MGAQLIYMADGEGEFFIGRGIVLKIESQVRDIRLVSALPYSGITGLLGKVD